MLHLRLVHDVRQPSAQRLDQLVHRLLIFAILRLTRLRHSRPGQSDPKFNRQPGSLPFQPVAQVQGR